MPKNQLAQRGCTHILLYLLDEETAMVSQLVRRLPITQDPIYKALPILVSLGLIKEKLEAKFPRRRMFSLTEKGRRVAEKLNEIEAILK